MDPLLEISFSMSGQKMLFQIMLAGAVTEWMASDRIAIALLFFQMLIAFTAIFEGNDKIISNLYIDSS